MADEKKVTLADLGVEDNDPQKKPVETKTIITDGGTPVTSVATEAVTDGPIKEEKKERKILTPNKNDEQGSKPAKYKEIGNVNQFLGRKPKEPPKSPIRKTLDGLYEKADQEIDRTKKELIAPGGRIEQAKIGYIETNYPKLMKRAKTNPRLMDRINKLNQIIDTDPRFDGITDVERKGYILFVIAKKKDETGIDNEYFGIESQTATGPRLSSDNMKAIDAIMEESDDINFDDDDFLSLGEGKGTNNSTSEDKVSYGDADTYQPAVNVAPSKTATVPDISKGKVVDDSVKLDEDISLIDEEMDNAEAEEILEDAGISEEESKENQKAYKAELIRELRLNRTDDLEGFSVATKPITLKSALKPKTIGNFTYAWPLPYTGISVEMTPLNGDEIITLNPNNTNFETIKGLNSVFSIIYRHIVNQNKAPFETWLRQTSDYDIDSLIFAGHAATFKDNNYITYECSNPKCKKIFLQKKDIMDMVIFPNDEVKDRFNSILNTENVMSQTYKTTPKRISDDYAIGFVSQSIYSNLFEPASLPSDFSQKYGPIVSLMSNIDKVYRIDNFNKRLIPINFGVVENSLSKTIQRKVKALYAIFQTFTPDERAIAVAETQKISNQLDKWKITYCIPETVCPHCGKTIERQESSPLNILFTRAQLAIVPAFISE